MVSMRSVIASPKFQKAEMELPLALGKTISNETFVVDLAKMPHLLMAGATGQGKSVGLNAILASLLYKKHPAEVKFVLVDPKKVELTLFNKIERHYLAKLPDTDEAIITDTTKVIHTLNSLCIEMDQRYDLLKDAMVRNIKEYNTKFKERKLNPEEGHRYLPYIVLVVDEFADLIMTAGNASGVAIDIDVVTGFTAGALATGGDHVDIDISDINNALGGANRLVNSAQAHAAADDTPVLTTYSGATDMGAAATDIIVLSGNFSSTDEVETAIETGGTRQFLVNDPGQNGALAANDAFLLIYDNDVNSFLATAQTASDPGNDTAFASGAFTVTNIMQFNGVSDATAFVAANFDFV